MARCGGETKVGNCIRQRLGHGETRTAPDTSILGGAGRSQTVPMTFCSRDADVGANAGRNELAVDEECKGLQLSCAIPTSRMMLRRPRRVASLSRGGELRPVGSLLNQKNTCCLGAMCDRNRFLQGSWAITVRST